MDQASKILELVEGWKSILEDQFGPHSIELRIQDGKKQVILIDEQDEIYVLTLVFSESGAQIMAVPEEALEADLGMTELEKSLLDAAGKRAIHVLTRKFSERTGWELVDFQAVFMKREGRIFLSCDQEGLHITEGELADFDDEDDS